MNFFTADPAISSDAQTHGQGQVHSLASPLASPLAQPLARAEPLCGGARHCVLHIGLEKTGTTSIQQCLAANRYFLAQGGILFPFSAGRANHLRLVSACLDLGAIDNIKADQLARTGLSEQAYRQRVLAEFDQELTVGQLGRHGADAPVMAPPIWNTLVLSSELISSRLVTDAEIDRLLSWVAKYAHTIDIIVFLRRQDRLAVSRFSSSLRAGSTNIDGIFDDESRRLFNAAAPERRRDDLQDFYDYDSLLQRFERAAHRCSASVRIRPQIYDSATGSNNSLTVFLGLLGLAPEDLPHLQQRSRWNAGLSGPAQHALVAVNKALAYQLPNGALNPVRRQIVQQIEAAATGPARPIACNPAKAFYHRFVASNEAVRQRYFPAASRLFDEGFDGYADAADSKGESEQRRLGQNLARRYMRQVPILWLKSRGFGVLRATQNGLLTNGVGPVVRGLRRAVRGGKHLARTLSLRIGRAALRLRQRVVALKHLRGFRSAESPHFTIARILGNDLPPRQAKGQMLRNLRTILELEPAFDNCRKVFVLNRLFDKREEDEARWLIEEAGHTVLVRSFTPQAYADCELDLAALVVRPQTASCTGAAALKLRNALYFRLCAQKIRYAFDINGARNQALSFGRQTSDWTFILDGACFVSAEAAQRLFKDARGGLQQPYLIVPMTRLVSDAALDSTSCQANWREEPQIAFHASSKLSFDERYMYGAQDKTSLLTALGVPGPWQHWRKALSGAGPKVAERFCFNTAKASVFRLPSQAGEAALEAAGAAPQRYENRNQAILEAITRLDKLCNVPASRRFCSQVTLPRAAERGAEGTVSP